MPANDHLTWDEIRDFSGGIYTSADFLMPASGFQVMQDCYPRGKTGLRAFFKPTTLPTTGIGSTTLERPCAISPLITSTGIAYLLLTRVLSTGQMKGYHMPVGGSSWTLDKTFTAHTGGTNNGAIATVCTYHDNTNSINAWIVGVTHNKDDGTEDGWWEVTQAGTWTRINATQFAGPTQIQYQSRIVGGVLNTLWWTDPGAVATPPAANFLTVQSGNNDVRDIITALIPYSPTSLLVGTVGSGWWVIEGDITDPVVRQMGLDHSMQQVQKCVTTQNGAVFTDPTSGVYMTRNMAATFDRLDPQLAPLVPITNTDSYVTGFGYLGGFLFAPGGRVTNLDDQSGWFTLSAASGSTPVYAFFEQVDISVNGVAMPRGVIAPQYCSGFVLNIYSLDESSGGSRYETYTVKTAPIRNDKGRWMHIREVQVDLDCFGSASTVAVTVNGTTRTSATLPAGTNELSFLFDERARYLDVQVVPNSNTNAVEAPVIEAIRIATRSDAHQIT